MKTMLESTIKGLQDLIDKLENGQADPESFSITANRHVLDDAPRLTLNLDVLLKGEPTNG